ncbi:hypothetical protein NL108_003005 [Boleophthalmus pectinirostris]|nr:hypothetical protein NL108_003005 [Boleophthalmus pectinirostris]
MDVDEAIHSVLEAISEIEDLKLEQRECLVNFIKGFGVLHTSRPNSSDCLNKKHSPTVEQTNLNTVRSDCFHEVKPADESDYHTTSSMPISSDLKIRWVGPTKFC